METEKIKKKKNSRKLKKWHKWVGLVFAFFLFMFAFSGIFLNHRQAISSWDMPRSILWKDYRYDNWNNGSVKGTFPLSPDSLLIYGNNGIWLTDPLHTAFVRYSNGIRKGADNNTAVNIVKDPDGRIFAATTFSVYELDEAAGLWQDISARIGNSERISDIAAKGDTLVVMSRSHIFVSQTPYTTFEKHEIPEPEGYEKKTTWFRMMWTLHSGELFGLPGKIFIDIAGVLTIILCVTGVILTFCPGIIRRRKRKNKDTAGGVAVFKDSMKWHNKVGSWFLVLFLFVAVTGMFLRPPLMIAIIRSQTKPIPGSTLDSPNPWHDKLRCLRFDAHTGEWLIYSSGGFYATPDLSASPKRLASPPPVSVMGVTVMEQADSLNWIVGSFSGIYKWNRETGVSTDLFTGEPYVRRGGMPVFSNAVTGFSADFTDKTVVFDYSAGAKTIGESFAEMPSDFGDGRISFWHWCLEVHVGRIYAPIWGSVVSGLFIPVSGILFILVIITGYIVHRRHHRKRKKKTIPAKE